MKNRLLVLPTVWVTVLLVGCGGGAPDCSTKVVLSVFSDVAVADHAAKAPGNMVRFGAYPFTQLVHPENQKTCMFIPPPGGSVPADWSVSDPVHVTISSARDQTNGVATCVGATVGAVTVTGSVPGGSTALTATGTMTCQ